MQQMTGREKCIQYIRTGIADLPFIRVKVKASDEVPLDRPRASHHTRSLTNNSRVIWRQVKKKQQLWRCGWSCPMQHGGLKTNQLESCTVAMAMEGCFHATWTVSYFVLGGLKWLDRIKLVYDNRWRKRPSTYQELFSGQHAHSFLYIMRRTYSYSLYVLKYIYIRNMNW